MKAEHRKELETNVLADRVGRVVQGMKQAPQKRTMVWLVLAIVVVVVVWFVFRWKETRRVENSEHWVIFEDGNIQGVKSLITQFPQSNQAKAAEFEMYYVELRAMLRFLATSPTEVLKNLDLLEANYKELANGCKDDKVLLPEALYAQAVIQETRIVKDDDNWKAALATYKEVADNHKDSAFGKLALKRVEVLNDKDKRDALLNIYRDLRITFVRDTQLPPFPQELLPAEHPPIAPKAPGIP